MHTLIQIKLGPIYLRQNEFQFSPDIKNTHAPSKKTDENEVNILTIVFISMWCNTTSP